MAFGDEISFSMWNHNMEIQDIPDCHHSDNSDFDDCESVCCYDKDYTTNTSLISTSSQNIIKKYKAIISFFNIWVLDNLVFDWNFVWNTSPPNYKIPLVLQNNLYINLVWLVKSNT